MRKLSMGCALACLGLVACGASSSLDTNADASAGAGGGSAGGPLAGSGGVAGATGGGSVGGSGGSGASTDKPLSPPSKVSLSLGAADQAELAALRGDLAAVAGVTAKDLSTRHPVTHGALGYDATKAVNLDKLAASHLVLPDAELAVLGTQGFVISKNRVFPTFVDGYSAIYADHLPLFVSSDSILEAVHRSYDKVLRAFEEQMLVGDLETLLTGMRAKLAASTAGTAETRADADLYLAVPLALLKGQSAAPVAGGSQQAITALVNAATLAQGLQSSTLFGVSRDIDMSQFKPRGHYTESVELQQYFRAMMWLGRIEFRLLETQPDGSQLFYRRQADAMLYLSDLLGTDGNAIWQRMEKAIRSFVGESDNMTPEQVPQLLAKLGVTSTAAAAAIDDQTMAQTIVDGGFGAQKIASQLIVNDGTTGTLPLNRSFLVFGQRYVVDSHVFSNVVHDRVAGRMMPNPLDVDYAALGNDDAIGLLSTELARYSYAPALESTRLMVEAHGDTYWDTNLYTAWLGSLRALSPAVALAPAAGTAMPSIAATEGWARRIVNTQLGSWAELRHDTILYAKQSYTSGVACEFPDAYIDPYPELFRRLAKLAEKGRTVADLAVAAGKTDLAQRVTDYFTKLGTVTTMLGDMADQELRGTPFTQAQMDFINQTVAVHKMCGGAYADGWYPGLFFAGDSTDYHPTIADVHTQYTDEAGTVVGKVLHVGTGNPRLMVATANTCTGPKAYTGLVFAYHEIIKDNFQRLTDDDWQQELTLKPADVPWIAPVTGP